MVQRANLEFVMLRAYDVMLWIRPMPHKTTPFWNMEKEKQSVKSSRVTSLGSCHASQICKSCKAQGS